MFPEQQLDYLYTMRVESEKSRAHARLLAYHGMQPMSGRAGATRSPPRGSWRLARAFRRPLLMLSLVVALGMGIGRERLTVAAPYLKVMTQITEWVAPRDGLAIEDVKAKIVSFDDRSTLVVEGMLTNRASEAVKSSDIKISLVGPDRIERYAWITHPSQTRLGAGERVNFSARLESPPAGVVDAIVTMVAAGH